jgi:hypothetical protein
MRVEIVHSGKIINLLTLLSLNYHTRHTLSWVHQKLFHPLCSLKNIFSHSLAYSYLYVCYKLENYLIIFQHFHEYTNERTRWLCGVRIVWARMNESEQYDKHFISTAEWCYDNFHNHSLCMYAPTPHSTMIVVVIVTTLKSYLNPYPLIFIPTFFHI